MITARAGNPEIPESRSSSSMAFTACHAWRFASGSFVAAYRNDIAATYTAFQRPSLSLTSNTLPARLPGVFNVRSLMYPWRLFHFCVRSSKYLAFAPSVIWFSSMHEIPPSV